MSETCAVLRAATTLTVAGASLGFSLIGSPGTAFADSGAREIGRSPGREVVQFAPNAVSVTFSTELRESGASLSISTKNGEVGRGKVSTADGALRRDLVKGAPNGEYLIEWKAVAKNGEKMSGTFSFTAGHPNDDPLITGEPTPDQETGETAQPPTSSDLDPTATPSPKATDPTKANRGDMYVIPPARSQEPPSGGSYGSPLLALAVGALLVIASGLVSRRHGPVVAERLTIRTRRGVYSV
ncbi:copper resistance CopC family protein [Kineosporia babensis]|uniref:Copper resistance protein CopC n=1 Tax=Kineosporia babensis TaxID=499548 RepID=A0A9X1SVK5_9ACTN|nr:copper resistance protein CopC [Kineosporia babensis]